MTFFALCATSSSFYTFTSSGPFKLVLGTNVMLVYGRRVLLLNSLLYVTDWFSALGKLYIPEDRPAFIKVPVWTYLIAWLPNELKLIGRGRIQVKEMKRNPNRLSSRGFAHFVSEGATRYRVSNPKDYVYGFLG